MRSHVILSLVLGVSLAGCATNYNRNADISCTDAIRIAEHHSVHHPAGGDTQNGRPFRYVERAGWDRAEGVWLVDLMADGGNYGREYSITSNGQIIGYRLLDRGSRQYYGPDLTDNGFHGYEGDDGYGHVRGDEGLSPVGEYTK